jgi:hypothetical protein
MNEFYCNKKGCEIIEMTYPESKPFANEYSCRLRDPSKYDRFRRENNAGTHNGKRLDFIWGIKGNKVEIQAIRMPKKDWSKDAAKKYCNTKEHILFE